MREAPRWVPGDSVVTGTGEVSALLEGRGNQINVVHTVFGGHCSEKK